MQDASPFARKAYIQKVFQEPELGRLDTWAHLRRLETIPFGLYYRITCCLDASADRALLLASKGLRNRMIEAQLNSQYTTIRITNDDNGFGYLFQVASDGRNRPYPQTLWFEPRKLPNRRLMASTVPLSPDTLRIDSFPAIRQFRDIVRSAFPNIKNIIIEYFRSPQIANDTSAMFLHILFSVLADARAEPEYLLIFTKNSIQPTTETSNHIAPIFYTLPYNVEIVWNKLVCLTVGLPWDEGKQRVYLSDVWIVVFVRLEAQVSAIDACDWADSKEDNGVNLWTLRLECVDVSTQDLIQFLELYGKRLMTLTLQQVYSPEGGWLEVFQLLRDKKICPKLECMRLVVGRNPADTQHIQEDFHSYLVMYDTEDPQINDIDQAIARTVALGY
ncbi:bata-ketoacyl synthase, N-terminal domain family protein [Aspergillus niger]|nr:hypothetical protein CBS11232_6290 [Aspergillus niger]KAI2918833.1 hypothetical protein CBS147371_3911 [Aspergillus niger]KAI2959951.1 hypothetical protein CBS147322_1052 [Aspergillus niger]KAI2986476.1 hypothetical protein CBS147344_5428 [Aspergillus niger]GJP95953.1 bata-ketoacyl synthase, N-terminal domain family protein [Aspergillus niger]